MTVDCGWSREVVSAGITPWLQRCRCSS